MSAEKGGASHGRSSLGFDLPLPFLLAGRVAVLEVAMVQGSGVRET